MEIHHISKIPTDKSRKKLGQIFQDLIVNHLEMIAPPGWIVTPTQIKNIHDHKDIILYNKITDKTINIELKARQKINAVDKNQRLSFNFGVSKCQAREADYLIAWIYDKCLFFIIPIKDLTNISHKCGIRFLKNGELNVNGKKYLSNLDNIHLWLKLFENIN